MWTLAGAFMSRIYLLTIVLRIHAVVLLLALVPMLIPFEWMNVIHQSLGMGDLPRGPIVEYLTRSLSLVYALHGAVCLLLTLDIPKYLPLIRQIAVVHFLFGVVITGIDLYSTMPIFWTIGEGPMIAFFAVFVFVFCGKCLDEISS